MADTESDEKNNAVKANAIKALNAALGSKDVPKIYFNQFHTFVGSHDITILAGMTGVPQGVLSMTYPMAKSLAAKIAEAIAGYEKTLKVPVVEASVLDKSMKAVPQAVDISQT